MQSGSKKMFKKITLCLSIALFVIVFCNFAFSSADEVYLIKAKKIYTVNQGIIENGMILVKNGKIAKIGKDIAKPTGAKELQANVIIPGLIDMHTHVGVYSIPLVEENSDGNEMTNPVTPQVRAMDSFNFEDPSIPVALAAGVTTIVSRPGSGNVIGGTSVAVKLKNASPEEMVIKEICDLKMAIEGNPVGVYQSRNQMPSSLMAVYFLARKAFIEAQEYRESWEKYEKDSKEGKEAEPPKRDLGKEVVVKALKREIPVHIHCATASEMMSCIRLAEEFNFKLSLAHCYWGYLIVDELAKHKDVYYNIGPPMFFNYFENPLKFKNNAAILANAGLKVSLQTDAVGGGQQNLLHLASLCVRYGMKEDQALKSVTLWAAEAVDLADRVGSIEEGKDADLVFLDGEPFEFTTNVEKVLIDGKIEYKKADKQAYNFESAIADTQAALTIPDDFNKADKFAIKGGTVFTMAGEIIKDGVILVREGKIENIGKNISIPDGYPVVEVGESVIMPGLISARSYNGISSNWRRQSSIDEMSKSIVPEMEVKNAIEPQAPAFWFSRELGITTAMVTPGDRNVIGGQGVVLKTVGDVVDKMIIKDNAVMLFGLGRSAKRKDKMPTTRMGIAALLRETLTKAQEYKDKIEQYEKDKKGKKPQRDLSMEALIPVLKGEMPVMIHCERKDDILTALRIADEYKLRVILDGATDAYKVVNEIKKRNIPVVLEDLFRGIGSNIEDKGFNPENPSILAKAGIIVAFRPGEGSWYTPAAGWGGGDLFEIAALAFKNGMPEEEALKAITINAAKAIGLEKKVGSLEKGKDADILILGGHPFKTRSIPQAVFIDGKLIYQMKEAEHLR
jgi:imidazolonepropionase-like amidohydrolase